MGYGAYSHEAHVALTSARAASSEPVVALVDPRLSPLNAARECRDSDEHPESLGVAFVLDVSGSMGRIPHVLATRTLPTFMRVLLDAGVAHPQLMFMAVGHAIVDHAPLQVGQFESSAALIDDWLCRLWLEGGGAGQHEAYELAMYFAARRVHLDSVAKRGRRGYLFLTADTSPNPAVSAEQVRRLIGDAPPADLPIRDLLDELQRTFEPFVMLAPGSSPRTHRAWRDLLGDRVLGLRHVDDAAMVAAGVVALLEGSARDVGVFADRLVAGGLTRADVARVVGALVPFAAGIGKDGVPTPRSTTARLPRGDRASGHAR